MVSLLFEKGTDAPPPPAQKPPLRSLSSVLKEMQEDEMRRTKELSLEQDKRAATHPASPKPLKRTKIKLQKGGLKRRKATASTDVVSVVSTASSSRSMLPAPPSVETDELRSSSYPSRVGTPASFCFFFLFVLLADLYATPAPVDAFEEQLQKASAKPNGISLAFQFCILY